ncbi:MAG TPA: PilZ domain-containing protein [Rhodocyclaceae bacterium]|nr:PilZ domain-containing protein [Rhodocyclaceae bacterium]
MQDKRRHQRIRFSSPPPIAIGSEGASGAGSIENVSLSGLMLRSDLTLEVGRRVGCEFSLFGPARIDLTAVVVNRLGNLYGLRFEPGPISRILISDAMAESLAEGHASSLSMHEVGGNKVMRIAGGLNGALQNDVTYSLTRVGVDEMDLSGVTAVDAAGLDLCLLAQGRYGVRIGRRSACFAKAWHDRLGPTDGVDARI